MTKYDFVCQGKTIFSCPHFHLSLFISDLDKTLKNSTVSRFSAISLLSRAMRSDSSRINCRIRRKITSETRQRNWDSGLGIRGKTEMKRKMIGWKWKWRSLESEGREEQQNENEKGEWRNKNPGDESSACPSGSFRISNFNLFIPFECSLHHFSLSLPPILSEILNFAQHFTTFWRKKFTLAFSEGIGLLTNLEMSFF